MSVGARLVNVESPLAMLAGIMLVSIASARGATAAMRLRRMTPLLASLVAFAGLTRLVARGGNGGGRTPTGTRAGTYMVTATATAGTQTAPNHLRIHAANERGRGSETPPTDSKPLVTDTTNRSQKRCAAPRGFDRQLRSTRLGRGGFQRAAYNAIKA